MRSIQQQLQQTLENQEKYSKRLEDYQNNYQSSCSPLLRKMVLFHTLQYLIHVRQEIHNLPQDKSITSDNMKQIKFQDSCIPILDSISQNYEKILKAKNKEEQLNKYDIMNLIIKTFESEITLIMILFLLDSICKLIFSVCIFNLLQAFSQKNISTAYIYTGVINLLWYFSQLVRISGFLYTGILNSHMKTGLIMLLYKKMLQMTTFPKQSPELGKITNLLANSIDTMQDRLSTIPNSTTIPIIIIGNCFIVFFKIGWTAVIGIVMTCLLIPLLNIISSQSQKIIEKINCFKDERVQITTNLIEGIKYVKLYGWELAFMKMIQSVRENQLDFLKKLAVWRSLQMNFGNSINFISLLAVIFLSTYFDVDFNTVQITALLCIMTSFKTNISQFSSGVGLYYQMKIVFSRFASVFNIKNEWMIKMKEEHPLSRKSNVLQQKRAQNLLEQQQIKVLSQNSSFLSDGTIILSHFNGYWEKCQTPCLKNINFQFQQGQLYGISGKVGSGKSTLLAAIRGEIPFILGKINVKGTIAFVEQEPIIFSGTIKDNIVFGKQINQSFYDRIIDLSCLRSDLLILSEGDKTIVGQKGTTLSGGQKARLSLARALYSKADIYLLDDPISAVDSKVAKIIFQQCLKPLSKQKTVILVTHQLNYLEECDNILILQEGEIIAKGIPAEMKKSLQNLAVVFDSQNPEEDANKLQEQEQIKVIQKQRQSFFTLSHHSNFDQFFSIEENEPESSKILESKFIEKEVSLNYKTYVKFFFSSKLNYVLIPFGIILLVASQIIIALQYKFLSGFEGFSKQKSGNKQESIKTFCLVISLLVLGQFTILMLKYFVINLIILLASKNIHENMIKAIVHSPGGFFDSTPSGILINKFSNDLGLIDNSMIFSLIQGIEGIFASIIAVFVMCQINSHLIAPSIFILTILVAFFIYARPALIACKQLDFQNKNALFHCFGETITGLTQIRIYNQRNAKLEQFSKIINNSSRAGLSYELTSRAFAYYATLVSNIFMATVMVLNILLSPQKNSSFFGILIVYLIQLCENLEWAFRQILTTQGFMVNAERLLQFNNLDREKQLRTSYDSEIGLTSQVQAAEKEEDVHQVWPPNSLLQIKNLSARYKKGLPLALKHVSFRAKPGEKIGIVGRTGAGKSSIIQAIFRLIEPETGSIYQLDDYNALDMGLHSLRKHISVIPQVPFLFKGSVKHNIDPFDTFQQNQLWQALKQSGLGQYIRSLPNQLQTELSISSSCFSAGQKQLLCLARALLRRNKFLVLDEATSNVDMKTDAFIQRVIRKSFADTTVITIAHRLSTIIDYDTILVMHKGRIVERGSPIQLVNKKGLFYEMLNHIGNNGEMLINNIKGKNKKSNV